LGLKETAALASAVAAMNTQRLGGRQGLPTYEQVQAFMAAQATLR
jgi:sugar/nucleoside kinase (ribokinase family)